MFDLLSQITTMLVIIATGAMSASAAIQAVRHRFDAFGATVLAVATAMGGGTVRDVLLGTTPVFWMTDMIYLGTAIPVALITFLLVKRTQQGGGQRARMLQYFDAIGLALFTIAGVEAALALGLMPPVAIIMGCITGTFGGLIRDLLCNVTPSVLKEDLYATISLLGGVLFCILINVFDSETASIWISFGAILAVRVWIIARRHP